MTENLEFDLTLYPEPILRKEAEPVEAFDEKLQAIVRGMFARMVESQGVGLAAPQVGLPLRILVLNASGDPADDLVLINPAIVDRSGPMTAFDEGCLSFPSIYAEIQRPDRCTIEAVDTSGAPFRAEYEGFLSRIVQHEYDHLEGVLLVDRMTAADKLRNKAALRELIDDYKRRKAS